eukprot:gene38390-46657_t
MPPKKKVKKAVKDDAEPREDEKVVENLESPQITPVVEVALPTPTADVPPKPNKASRLSVDAISSSPIVDLAATYWATPHDGSDKAQFDENLVNHLYTLAIAPLDQQKIAMLELSGYLENYLWPFLHIPSNSANPSLPHLYSILVLMHEKISNHINPFSALHGDILKLQSLFNVFIDMFMQSAASSPYPELPAQYTSMFLKLIIEAYRSAEYDSLKRISLRYVSLPIWSHMSRASIGMMLKSHPSLKAPWAKYIDTKKRVSALLEPDKSSSVEKDVDAGSGKKKRKGGASSADSAQDTSSSANTKYKEMHNDMQRDANFIPHVLGRILLISHAHSSTSSVPQQDQTVLCCMLDLVYELLSTLHTRKYLCSLLVDMHFIFYLKKHTRNSTNVVIARYVEIIEDYVCMEMDNILGTLRGKQEVWDEKTERVYRLQQVVYGLHISNQDAQAPTQLPSYIQDLVFSSITMLMQKNTFYRYFELFSHAEVLWICKKLKIFNEKDEKIYGVDGLGQGADGWFGDMSGVTKEDLCDWLFDYISIHPSYIEKVASLPTYPTEVSLWDEVGIPPAGGRNANANSGNEGVVPLPKLNLSFLNIHDYF